ncbi:MAG: hypothetical protein ACT4P0_05700 [Panacagrimonas sp.]
MAMLVRNEKTYQRIVGRQYELRWGSGYDPSIRATPREAPGASTHSTVYSHLMGRRVHCLSRNELKVALIALYHPAIWYVREQQMLFWQEREHFLHGHERSESIQWPPIRGTWEVAKDLGFPKQHPTVRVYSAKHGRKVRVPFPYLGDFLIFLQDSIGPYAVNLSVKDKLEDFRRPFSRLGAKTKAEQEAAATARHTIERVAYEAGKIRTEQVAGKLIPDGPYQNLRFVFVQNRLADRLTEEQIDIGVSIANDRLRREQSPMVMGAAIDRELGLKSGQGIAIVWRGIWTRRIRADLHRNIVPDSPLIPEQKDLLSNFDSWFRR